MTLTKSSIYNVLILLMSLSVSLGLAEIITRQLMKNRLDVWDERNLMFRHDRTLGWFPIAGGHFGIKGDPPLDVQHNSRGFRDVEHMPDARPGIMFLGDSFVWGFGVDQSARFTDLLRAKLPGASIYNLGVSGYGTDQEYLLLTQQMDFYHPRIVFLEFTTDNDEDDNSTDLRYGTYFKPYFRTSGDSLKLEGVPVPESLGYFIASRGLFSHSYLARLTVMLYYKYAYPPPKNPENPTRAIIKNMHSYISSRGAVFLVGLQQPHPQLEMFLREEHIPYVELTNPHVFDDKGRHWTAEGHTYVCEKIYDFISKGNYLHKSIP